MIDRAEQDRIVAGIVETVIDTLRVAGLSPAVAAEVGLELLDQVRRPDRTLITFLRHIADAIERHEAAKGKDAS